MRTRQPRLINVHVLRNGGVLARAWWCLPILCLLLTGVTALAEARFSFESTPGQLPKTVVPRHYAIRIQPDLVKFTTHGRMTVEIEVLKPVKEIVFNALEMEVTKATLVMQQEIKLQPKQNPGKQTVSLELPEEIEPGPYRLLLEFDGKIGEQAQGLFYVKYPTHAGNKVMLGTQMEPVDARRVFPCWDEPVFRATYELTVVVPQKHLTISNTAIERETKLGDGLKEVHFARTPPMPSYLVVFVSGELEELKGTAEGVQIRIITTEGKKSQGRYALEATKKLLAYYNDYFGLKYPLAKLDQIAIPGGFDGAMENWGAITYNESMLLFDPATSSQETKQEIFVTVAHEMAHQWFGNLVTTAWWNNLWLNEGFASWMEVKATDHFNPAWQVCLNANSDKSTVMSGDARSTTHPIQQDVENESQANDAFDSITYQKGQAFLRMLESYLGEEEFRRGIHRYLSDHLYSNTTTADLWEALEKVSGKPIKAISAGWTEQPGLPLIRIKTDCVDGRQMVRLEQERFTVMDPKAAPLQWKIPVTLMDIAHTNSIHPTLLEKKSASVPMGDCDAVIKANANDTGYYRVLYEPGLFHKLQQHINQLPAADRLELLHDTWAMVEAARSPASIYLDLLESIRGEKSFAVWQEILSTLDYIDGLEQKQPGRKAFQQYACSLLRPELQQLGWKRKTGETSTDSLLRGKIIERLGCFGDEKTIAEAKGRFAKFLVHASTLSADLRPAVLKLAGRYSDKGTYDQIHGLARKADGTEERQLYYRALAGAVDPELAKETLAFALKDESVPQEAANRVIEVAQAGEHTELAWIFADQHMKELLAKLDSLGRNLYVPSIFSSFSEAARADELEEYVQRNFPKEAMIKAVQFAEGIRLRAILKERELPVIDKWMAANVATQVHSQGSSKSSH